MELPASLDSLVEECGDGIFGRRWECYMCCAWENTVRFMLATYTLYRHPQVLLAVPYQLLTYPGFCSVIQKSAGSPCFCPKPI